MRIPAVDGLRGLAILLVIYQHSLATGVGQEVVAITGWRYPYLVANAWMGVGLFFVLSGFVLALPFFQGERHMTSRTDAGTFLVHRAKRLLPLFVFMAFVSFAFTLAKNRPDWPSLLLALSTLSMFTRAEFFPTINGPFWSLAVEIWFSAMFPLMLVAAARWGLPRAFAATFVIAFAMRMGGAFFPFVDVHVNPVKDFVLGRVDDFCVGMGIAWLYVNGRLPRVKPVWLICGAALILAATGYLWDLRVQGRLPRVVVPLLHNFAQIGFGAMLIGCLQPGSTWFTAWPLRILGAMCFSLYCWHGLLIAPRLLANPLSVGHQLEFWLTTLALSLLTYRFVEFPKATWRDLLLLPRQPSTSGNAPANPLPVAENAKGKTDLHVSMRDRLEDASARVP
jgi:peptidoglycan/LPS O-acetylase OafA/YrhL